MDGCVAAAEKFPALASIFYELGPERGVTFVSAYLHLAAAAGHLRIENCDFAAEQFLALVQTNLCMRCRLRLIAMPSDFEMEQVIGQAVKMFLTRYRVVTN